MRYISAIFSAGYFLARIYRTPASLFRQALTTSNCTSVSSMASCDKSPNILVYTGESNENVFKNAVKNLSRILHADKYVIYELTKSQVLVQPWKENIALLVVLCDAIDESTAEVFRNFLAKDGKMLVSCCNFTMPELGLSCTSSTESFVTVKHNGKVYGDMFQGKVSYNFPSATVLATNSYKQPVIMKATCNQGILVITAVHLVLDFELVLPKNVNKAPNYGRDRTVILQSLLSEVFGLEMGFVIVGPKSTPGFVFVMKNAAPHKKLDGRQVPVEKVCCNPVSVPLILPSETEALSLFDEQGYSSNLTTKSFGSVVIYFPIVTSTMIPAENLMDIEGVVVIAGRQTSGCGRGNNQWISPEGCAMFTVHFTLSLTSRLGQHLSILQHMTTLAAVLAVRNIPGYEKLNLGLKWPNDLFYEKSEKIGGALVRTTFQGDLIHAFVSLGVNVSNTFPTSCINSIIQAHNKATGGSLKLLTPEVVIARTLTELEDLVEFFIEFGPERFHHFYHVYWLHSDQRIMLESLKKEATIKELDKYGYLVVETDDGKRLTLQPDGNRFDMMKNLIVSKCS